VTAGSMNSSFEHPVKKNENPISNNAGIK